MRGVILTEPAHNVCRMASSSAHRGRRSTPGPRTASASASLAPRRSSGGDRVARGVCVDGGQCVPREPAGTQCAEQLGEMILRRTPDPRNVQDSLLFSRRESPVHFLDHFSTDRRDDNPNRLPARAVRVRRRSGRLLNQANDVDGDPKRTVSMRAFPALLPTK